MADDQMAAGPQALGESGEQALLGRLVEIDHHVAAEDHVEPDIGADRPVVRQQVDLPKRDLFAQTRFDFVVFPVRATAPQEILAQQGRRDRGDALAVVDGVLGVGEDIGIDVRRQLPDVPTSLVPPTLRPA